MLDAPPVCHDASDASRADAAIAAIEAARRSPRGAPANGLMGAAAGITEESAALTAGGRTPTVDPQALRRAREIAARLAIPRARRDAAARRGGGELVSVSDRGAGGEIDLDATLATIVERPLPGEHAIVVRERRRTRRAVVLLVDVSGSMRGERIVTAAATVGALAGELAHDDLAVVAFWSDAAVLAHLGRRRAPRTLLTEMLRIPARGLTNVTFALQIAARELTGARDRDARAILLSDCVHNAGPDPRRAAAQVPRLDVLLDVTGESDPELASALAHLGRGRLAVARDHRDVAPAISRCFAR